MIGTEGTRLLREKRGMGDPAGAPRRLPPARGKRVPGVEIKSTLYKPYKKGRQRQYYRIYLQYVRCIMAYSCCRQKRFHLNVKTKLIGTEGTRLLREKRGMGDPAGAPRADRPRKASAWSGNQQVDGGNFTELDGPKNGCSFIIEGKGFTNIYSVNTKSIYLSF
ncbi:hypothetical protein ACIP97_07230 [Peribacillus frigoritolerans]|uniref:hypothetical protein n=1 Tax=Peribacillus frigoritolerans TaxID=450367 RepID=UPI0037F10F51